MGLGLAAALLMCGPAAAHPMGNFSVNHLDVVRISSDRVDVRYVLDQAEIPTFQERGLPVAARLAAARDTVRRHLRLRVDGRTVPLVPQSAGRISFPAGQGGLRTMRVELVLGADVRQARRVELADRTFADRIGWRDVIVRPGRGTRVRSSVPASEPTNRLRVYPASMLTSPANRRTASFVARAGDGSVVAPRPDGEGLATTRERGGGAFAALFDDAAAGKGVLVLLLLAAFAWGALHALSPGHGKAMVAAYLVGTRGTARQAVVLGATVTVSHTVGVFALGVVALLLSAHIVPEHLYSWLNLVAGMLVIGVGAWVLGGRLANTGHEAHQHAHAHAHGHDHVHRGPDQGHDAFGRGIIPLGVSAGIIPCPSALVVLLGAIAQHQVALGLLLILAFSFGLAATLTGIGLAVVWTSGMVGRLARPGHLSRVVRVVPTISAALIVCVGIVLTAQAVPQVI